MNTVIERAAKVIFEEYMKVPASKHPHRTKVAKALAAAGLLARELPSRDECGRSPTCGSAVSV